MRGTTEESRFDPRKEKRALRVTKTRTHFAPGDLSPGLKRSQSGAVHSSTLRSLRMSGAVPTLPHMFPWRAQWLSELPKIVCFTLRLTFSNPNATLYLHFRQLLYVTYGAHHEHHARQPYTTRSRAPTIASPLLAANCLYQNNARFEVLTVFWHVTTCRLVNSYRRFGVEQCLYLQYNCQHRRYPFHWHQHVGITVITADIHRIWTCWYSCHHRRYPPGMNMLV
jgi:hypothetical protein